ncbi:hypothetical protein KEH51_03185 [[Brevibacterium] frigoritolerans]|uniref:Uncharacterized protein n=1 Tax=Peribacillus frigoritolerans TaxID=450367 RepID=A0A941FHG5_9BACI|nr:hypothetical protein [Peribacillus frigoritolerans]
MTSGEVTEKYHFGLQVQSDWQEGSAVQYLLDDGRITDHGHVLKCEPLHLLSFTWIMAGDETLASSLHGSLLNYRKWTIRL